MGVWPSSRRLVVAVAVLTGLAFAEPVFAEEAKGWAEEAKDRGDSPQVFSRSRFLQELRDVTVPRGVAGAPAVAAAGHGQAGARERLAISQEASEEASGVRAGIVSVGEGALESINRGVDDLNQFVGEKTLDPAADYYQAHMSPSVQDGMVNVFANLREPITVGSSLLQGSLADAGTSSARFVINSTVGLLGYYDRASPLGFSPVVRTLDEVLCEYGVPPGPYMVMPVFGPSSARDTAGRVATMVAQYLVLGPLIVPYRITDTVVQYAEVRDGLTFVDSVAQDPYERRKHLFTQMQVLPCGAQTKFAHQLFAR